MNFIDKVAEKWSTFCKKAKPTMTKIGGWLQKAWTLIRDVCKYMYKMRKIFLAVPVAVLAIILAIYNQANLPAVVGFDLQNNGAFAIQVVRELAVLAPLILTGLCLLLMFISKRLLTPWMVSLVSLILPVVILILNTFPN